MWSTPPRWRSWSVCCAAGLHLVDEAEELYLCVWVVKETRDHDLTAVAVASAVSDEGDPAGTS